MGNDLLVNERLNALMARREKRNPGIKNIRFTKFDKLKATQWNMFLAASKSDLLDDLLDSIL